MKLVFLNGTPSKDASAFVVLAVLNAKGHENVQYNLSNLQKLGTKDVYMSDSGLLPLFISTSLNLF